MQHLFTNWNQVLKRNEKKPKGSVVSAYLQKEKRMACHNAILFFTVVLLWLIYASAQRSAGLFDSRSSEFYPGSAGSVAFLHHPLRVERKIAQRATWTYR
ncbi:unnamed protein product [Callosobruchus maculatus]|uniref:Uncharacterized protein n=1 Tax=Callosobruchus maculatus TaxID=64391 RepID=A0A653DCP1_CALMS|nr:unnamed protein product [Callosobruchus maculatus]